MAKAFDAEGFCNFYAGNYKRSAMAFDSAALIWKKANRLSYFKSLNDEANALMYHSEYHKALLAFFECLTITNELGDKTSTGKVLNNIGLVYESIGDADKAIFYEKRSLAYKMMSKDALSLARTYGNIGEAFSNKEMPDSAILYEQLSYKLYRSKNDKGGMAIALGDIGNMYKKKNKIDSAISYLTRAVAISQKLSNAENTANIEDDLAQGYMLKHDLKNTWKYASAAEVFVPQITDYEFLQQHAKLMYQYFKQQGNAA